MNIVLNTLLFLSIAIGSYYLMSVVQTLLHRDYGHRKKIKAVFEAHAIGHHGLYNPDNLQTEKFEECESHALNYYGIPVVVFAIFIYLYLGPLIMFAHLTGVFATFRWHLYLHEHYHLIDTPLERFAWFRKKRGLHFVHHRDARYNFAVVEFWIDNLMGTRRDN